jgi:hypothetical protein
MSQQEMLAENLFWCSESDGYFAVAIWILVIECTYLMCVCVIDITVCDVSYFCIVLISNLIQELNT